MPTQDIRFFQFGGGLNTEASPLNVPENDATDILNVVIERNGAVRRKAGFDYLREDSIGGFQRSVIATPLRDGNSPAPSGITDYPITSKVVTVVDDNGALQTRMLVIAGQQLHIYEHRTEVDMANINTLAQTQITLEASQFLFNRDNCKFYKTDIHQDRNKIILVNRGFGIKVMEWDTTSGEFDDPRPILGHVRDTDDPSAPVVDGYVVHNSVEYAAIAPSTNVEPGVDAGWEEYWNTLGSTVAGSAATAWSSGTSYVTNVVDVDDFYSIASSSTYRVWNTSAMAASRLWLSGMNKAPNTVFFSQVVTKDSQYGRFYQFADPFGKEDTATVATDGGTITINGATRIHQLHEFFGGILALAENGVWYIYGDSGFKATDFNVVKVSDVGVHGAQAAVGVDDGVIYFGTSSVQLVSRVDTFGNVQAKEISAKIDTDYNSLSKQAKAAGAAHYNNNSKKVYFLHNSTTYDWATNRNPYNVPTHFRSVLVLDVSLGAWYKYEMSADSTGNDVSIGNMLITDALSGEQTTVVVGADAVLASTVEVVASGTGATEEAKEDYLIFMQSSTTPTFSFGVGKMEGTSFQNFSVDTGNEESYSSYIESAYIHMGDIFRRKQMSYVQCLFKRVEDHIVVGDADTNPGGCFLRVNSDWASGSTAHTWGTAVQCYYPNRHHFITDGSDPEIEVCRFKRKVRNMGLAAQFRWENDGDKDFHLYGWQVFVDFKPTV